MEIPRYDTRKLNKEDEFFNTYMQKKNSVYCKNIISISEDIKKYRQIFRFLVCYEAVLLTILTNTHQFPIFYQSDKIK